MSVVLRKGVAQDLFVAKRDFGVCAFGGGGGRGI